ncbi:MAG: glycoside hydrolase family 31 protein [Lachnospiraceae bacterium]|nr:glycoside hydrolase family 31 protein [Lachnospiraceae bacterium]
MFMINIENNRLVWKTSGETVVIEPWGENALRVRSVMMGEILETDYALLPPKEQSCVIEAGKDQAKITNGKLTAQIVLAASGWRKDHGRITFYRQDGRVLFGDIDHEDSPSPHPRRFLSRGGGAQSLTCSFKAYEGERFYGMGQYQMERLDLKGSILELAQQNTQASVPFVVSSRGYGFFWHNPAIGQAVFGENKTVWKAESAKQCDYWVVAGDTPAEIQQAYVRATGLPPMMPEYGLGFWQSKARYWNQEQVLEVARGYKERSIPLDVLVIDFFHWPRMGDFRFDAEFFPDPEKMVQELRSMGIEPMVSVWTPVDYRSENFEEMMDRNLLVHVEQGVDITMRFFDGETLYVDMTNPEARSYVWDKLRKNYLEKGIHLFWLDEAEPGYTKYDYGNYRHYLGSSLEVGNIYPQMYTRLFYEGLMNAGHSDIVNLVRCAWAGSQRYGALVWSGDVASTWTAFRRQICAGLNMGMAGIAWWTTDIGGFHSGDVRDPKFRELLVRWFEWGTFCPVMRLHGARSPHIDHVNSRGEAILNEGAPNEVWSYGPELEDIFVRYIRLREKMRPYVRELMKEAHEKGTPVIRAMFYEFPDDSVCWDLKDQYMFGGDVLAAPIVYEDTYERQVYLPKGASWTLLYDGTVYQGGRTVTVPAQIDQIPVFLRDGRCSEWIG